MSNDKNGSNNSNKNDTTVLKHSIDVPVANFKPPTPPANQSGQNAPTNGNKEG